MNFFIFIYVYICIYVYLIAESENQWRLLCVCLLDGLALECLSLIVFHPETDKSEK